jgi:phage shock protein A
MALIRRVARLFRADFHAVLDRVEEPEALLRQAIREMEEDIAGDERTYRLREREGEQLANREEEIRQLQLSLTEKFDVCFGAGEEDLARTLMRRKLEAERSLQLLARRRDELGSGREALAKRLNDKRARYEGMRHKAALFDEQHAEIDAADQWAGIDVGVRDEDVEAALLKERQKRAAK